MDRRYSRPFEQIRQGFELRTPLRQKSKTPIYKSRSFAFKNTRKIE